MRSSVNREKSRTTVSIAIRGVVRQGDLLECAGDAVTGWFPVICDDEVCYISGKYAETLKV